MTTSEGGLIDDLPLLSRYWLMPEGQQVRLVLGFPGPECWSTMLRPRYPFMIANTGGRDGFVLRPRSVS